METIDSEVASLAKRVEFLTRLAAERSPARRPQGALLDAMSELFRPDAPRTDDLLRRRAAFVAAVLSRVIVHDVDGGFAVELEGPLVPPDAPVDPVNPATAMEPPGPHELSTNGLVRGQFAQVPSWRSPQVGFTVPPGSQRGGRGVGATATFDTAKEAILFVHEHSPDGPLFADNGPYAQAVRFRAEYPALHNLLRILRRHGTTPVAVLRDALRDEAISRGRVKASASFADVLTALMVAIDRGLVPGQGVYSGYRALRETETFLPSWRALHKWATRNGMTVPGLIERASDLRSQKSVATCLTRDGEDSPTACSLQVITTPVPRRDPLTSGAFCEAIRDAGQRYEAGRLFGGGRPTRERWCAVARDHGLAVSSDSVGRQLRELGVTADELIRPCGNGPRMGLHALRTRQPAWVPDGLRRVLDFRPRSERTHLRVRRRGDGVEGHETQISMPRVDLLLILYGTPILSRRRERTDPSGDSRTRRIRDTRTRPAKVRRDGASCCRSIAGEVRFGPALVGCCQARRRAAQLARIAAIVARPGHATFSMRRRLPRSRRSPALAGVLDRHGPNTGASATCGLTSHYWCSIAVWVRLTRASA